MQHKGWLKRLPSLCADFLKTSPRRGRAYRAGQGPAGPPISLSDFSPTWLGPGWEHALIRLLLTVGCGVFFAQSAAAQDIDTGRRHYGFCVACHGVEGRSGKPLYPILAGQRFDYLVQELTDFKSGVRRDPNMNAVAQTLDEQDIRDLSAYFSSREFGNNAFAGDNEKAARGKRRADFQCRSCHTEAAAVAQTTNAGRAIPRIDGQNYNYLVKQLSEFKSSRRDNDGGVMRVIASALTERDIDDLANYFGGVRTLSRASGPMVQKSN